jgi:predicted HAD superfamily phosphohydrolase
VAEKWGEVPDIMGRISDQERLESWLRFFTSNSTDEEELYNKIDGLYSESVRRNVAKAVAAYFIERDSA